MDRHSSWVSEATRAFLMHTCLLWCDMLSSHFLITSLSSAAAALAEVMMGDNVSPQVRLCDKHTSHVIVVTTITGFLAAVHVYMKTNFGHLSSIRNTQRFWTNSHVGRLDSAVYYSKLSNSPAFSVHTDTISLTTFQSFSPHMLIL